MTESLAVTMRTPGHDKELAAGLLLSEGVIRQARGYDGRADRWAPSLQTRCWWNWPPASILQLGGWRATVSSASSCGVCGKRAARKRQARYAARRGGPVSRNCSAIHRLPATLREHQKGFRETGGLHAAALVTGNGEIEAVFEDIGRHNALDKLIGWAALHARTPLRERILFLTSRGSFELVQKAAMAGAPVLATVGGPRAWRSKQPASCR